MATMWSFREISGALEQIGEGAKTISPQPELGLPESEAGQFDLGSLHVDLLEGVMQRVSDQTKKQVELIDRSFATVAHRLAWRHHHTLKVTFGSYYCSAGRIAVGSYSIKLEDAAAAARFLLARSAVIQHVEFDVIEGNYKLNRERCQGILEALLSSERLALRSIILHQPPVQLFGGDERLVALIRHHRFTLQEVGLHFHNDQPTQTVGIALSTCRSLRKLSAFVDSWIRGGRYSWERSLAQLLQRLQLESLTLAGSGCFIDPPTLRAILPSSPMLSELRFEHCGVEFSSGEKWDALANVRLLEADACSLHLIDGFSQAEANRVFAAVLPKLQLLVLTHLHSSLVYWKLMKKLVCAFLNRAGDHSLAVELAVVEVGGQEWRQPLTEWRAAFPDLSVERFGAETDDNPADGEAARPTLPMEFEHAAASEVFVLGRLLDDRRITIAVWHFKP